MQQQHEVLTSTSHGAGSLEVQEASPLNTFSLCSGQSLFSFRSPVLQFPIGPFFSLSISLLLLTCEWPAARSRAWVPGKKQRCQPDHDVEAGAQDGVCYQFSPKVMTKFESIPFDLTCPDSPDRGFFVWQSDAVSAMLPMAVHCDE